MFSPKTSQSFNPAVKRGFFAAFSFGSPVAFVGVESAAKNQLITPSSLSGNSLSGVTRSHSFPIWEFIIQFRGRNERCKG